MSEQTVAFRYAKSLIGLAQEKGVLDQVHQDMKFFSQVCDENRPFELALKSPIVKHYKKLEILEALFKERVHPVSFSIFDIITKKNREAVLPSVAQAFQAQYAEIKNIVTAHLTTAAPITDEQRKQFINVVADATGKTVELREKIDAKLIGGFMLRVGDKQIDASIKSRLNDLKLKFLQ
ncbi:MAG: ATP synthase F1 subunit delta [Spirosomataceae bacterium]